MSDEIRVSDDQLRAWDEVTCGATPGPWEALPIESSFDPKVQRSFVRVGDVDKTSYLHVAASLTAADARFVGIAREALPALINELMRLRQMHRAMVKAIAEDRSRRVLVAELAAQTLVSAVRFDGDGHAVPVERVAEDAVALAEAICERLKL